jgi:hypothetical protein
VSTVVDPKILIPTNIISKLMLTSLILTHMIPKLSDKPSLLPHACRTSSTIVAIACFTSILSLKYPNWGVDCQIIAGRPKNRLDIKRKGKRFIPEALPCRGRTSMHTHAQSSRKIAQRQHIDKTVIRKCMMLQLLVHDSSFIFVVLRICYSCAQNRQPNRKLRPNMYLAKTVA